MPGGELWRGTLQLGLENTYGDAVPATRRMYVREPDLPEERQSRPHKFATTTRDNTRAHTLGPPMASGKLSFPISSDEILEWLLLGIQGGVTPTGNLWTFQASEDLDSATVEWHDGANAWVERGVYVQQLHIAGSPNAENLVTVDLFGLDRDLQDITAGLSERTPTFFEGWETQFFLDDFGDTPATTPAPLTLLSWDITINNQLGRKFFADNVNAQGGTSIGELQFTATLVMEAASAIAQAEYANWRDGVLRTGSLLFGNNLLIPATSENYSVRIDMPGAWSALDVARNDNGTRAYSFGFEYVFEPVAIGAGCQILVATDRATAFTD